MIARAPFQILLFPFHFANPAAAPHYAIFRRRDDSCWQAIAGGGHVGETPEDAARRETFEEAGIADPSRFMRLDSMATVPAVAFGDFLWGPDTFVVPEYAFAAEVHHRDIRLSAEHTEYVWASYDDAYKLLTWDSNRNALWELNCRLQRISSTALQRP
jgi:dATP pyrophosphohydrolase